MLGFDSSVRQNMEVVLMTVLNILMLPFAVVFNIIMLEKCGFFEWLEDNLFETIYKKTKINLTVVCYFCFSFWISAFLVLATYLDGYNYSFNSLFLTLTFSTVLSRYLTIQILRK
jgi:hypothetical protein